MEADSDECSNQTPQTIIPLPIEPIVKISVKEPESPFFCKVCKLDYENSVKFEKHKKKVHGKTKIKCPICPTLFRRADHMRRHMRTVHCADQPSICPICKEDCKEHDSLSQHINSCHPSENQYRCNDCPYTTDNPDTLVSHKKLHVNTSKHVCNVCKASFKRHDHLNRHMKSLHLNHVVSCEVCERIFKRRDHVLRHMREKHGAKKSVKRTISLTNV